MKPKKANRIVTLETLAIMVKDGFDAVDKRFDAVDKRFDGLEVRIANLEERVLNIELRLASIEGILGEHSETLTRHSEELAWLHRKIDEMTNPQSPQRVITHREFMELEKRVSVLEKKITAK